MDVKLCLFVHYLFILRAERFTVNLIQFLLIPRSLATNGMMSWLGEVTVRLRMEAVWNGTFFGGFNTSYQKDQIFSSMHHWPTKLSVSHLTAEKWVPSRKSLVESPYASFRLTFLQNTSGLVWYLHKFARTVILTVAAYGTKTIADQHSITIECVGMPNHP